MEAVCLAGTLVTVVQAMLPVIFTLTPHFVLFIIFSQYVSQKIVQTILCVGGNISLIFEQASVTKMTNIPVIFRI
jgi:hypothetical protein